MKYLGPHKYKGFVKTTLHQLYQIDFFRLVISYIRYIFFVKIIRRLRVFDLEKKEISKNTVFHNLKGLKDLAVVRSNALIKPLFAIDKVSVHDMVLSIGPRTEGELFNLVGNGFYAKNIKAIDLISYSPWVDLGDMHQMPYEDNTFDVVIVGWVLAYSNEPARAAQEIVRIAKSDAIISVGIEYMGEENAEIVKSAGYTIGAGHVYKESDSIIELFKPYVNTIYFQQSISNERLSKKGSVIAIFEIKK